MRWDSEVGERVERDAPEVIASYNRHMGYVDLHSQIAQGTMTCRQRTTRWVQAAFQDMLDSQLANAFIIAKREMTCSGVAAVDHREFLCVLAHIFCDVPASTPAARRELHVALGSEGRIKVACTVCRLLACYKHYYQIHGVNLRTGPDEDETTESDQFWESFRSDLHKRFKPSTEDGSEEAMDEEDSE